MVIETLQDLAQAFKSGPYAWPGGYQLNLLLADGATLCWDCFRNEYGSIADDLRNNYETGWKPATIYIHEEGPSDYCAHCNKELPSESGEECGVCKEWGNNGQWNEEKEAFVCYECKPELKRCDQCEAVMIQGVYCHEQGCPNN